MWLEPKAAGKTPMCEAFQAAHEVIGGFVAEHPACFPPIVINITDGMATDGDAGQVLQWPWRFGAWPRRTATCCC